MKANGENVRRLTRASTLDTDPDWSPDGTRIVFARGRKEKGVWPPEPLDIYTMKPDGTHRRLLGPGADVMGNNPAWSPDGKRFVFVGFFPPGGAGEGAIGIFRMNRDGTQVVQLTVGGKQGDFGINDAFPFPDWQPR